VQLQKMSTQSKIDGPSIVIISESRVSGVIELARNYVKELGVSSITAIFGNSEEPDSQESDKLLQLYWNRAELKKEFAGMRNEQFKLQDRLKQEEGATARLQQKLDHIEELLIDPDWAANVMVFYQLRGLAVRCENKLALFAEQLKQQREQKQHNSVLIDWNEARSREGQVVEQQILEARDNVQQLEDQLQSERRRLMAMSGFLKIFRRRSVTAILDSLAQQVESVQLDAQGLAAQLQEIRDRKPPDTSGLSDAAKRTINFMIIAFAQQLVLMIGDDELADLAKESREKSVGAIKYGDRSGCSQLLTRVMKRIELLEQPTDSVAVLQKRAQLLAENAAFRVDSDVVPIAGSVSSLYDIDPNGLVNERNINVLGLNYWGISRVLSR
jgi:hypothetical protein